MNDWDCAVQYDIKFKVTSVIFLYLSETLSKQMIIIIIIIMSFTPVSFSYEDIGGVPSMQSCYSARMKRCGICMEERSPL